MQEVSRKALPGDFLKKIFLSFFMCLCCNCSRICHVPMYVYSCLFFFVISVFIPFLPCRARLLCCPAWSVLPCVCQCVCATPVRSGKVAAVAADSSSGSGAGSSELQLRAASAGHAAASLGSWLPPFSTPSKLCCEAVNTLCCR